MPVRDYVPTAPEPGCICEVCLWANRRIAKDKDLAENYELYLAGYLDGLVKSDERD